MSIMGRTDGAAVRIYQITYIVGLTLGIILYMAVNKLFPPPGLGVSEAFDHQLVMTDGIETPSENSQPLDKRSDTSEKQVVEELKN